VAKTARQNRTELKTKAVSVPEIQLLDRTAIDVYGIPTLVLMENAGCVVAREVSALLKGKEGPSVCIFCGTGNNGGDGLVAARHLEATGAQVTVFLVGRSRDLKNDAALEYRITKKCGLVVKEISLVTDAVSRTVAKSDVVVDAIFGVGLNRDIGEPQRSVIEFLNQRDKPILAVDIPSGLDGTTGEIYGVCVQATRTVTFSFPKKGFYLKCGPQVTGKVVVADIGIPRKLKRTVRQQGR